MILKYLIISMALFYFFTTTIVYLKTVKKLSTFALKQKDLSED